MRRALVLLIAAGSTLLTACATMLNPGQFRTFNARTAQGTTARVRVARVVLKNWAGRVEIYDGDKQAVIVDDAPQYLAGEMEMCRNGAYLLATSPDSPQMRELAALQRRQYPNGCTGQYYVMPVVLLDPSVPHTLRIVDGSREATITLQRTLKVRWIWFNLFLGPAYPVGLLVDGLTKNWSYYSQTIDIGHALQNAQPVRAPSP